MKPTRVGGHGHHAREGIQLRQVPAAASQGAGDGRVLAGARGNGAGDLPGEGGVGRHLIVAEGATELNCLASLRGKHMVEINQ